MIARRDAGRYPRGRGHGPRHSEDGHRDQQEQPEALYLSPPIHIH